MNAPVVAKDIMVTKLVTLSPDMDVYDAISRLLSSRISGAPVVDEQRQFLGVFSEKCCMSILVKAAYEQLPTTKIAPFMDTDARTITEEADLLTIAQIFTHTHYRRLPVLRDGMLVGQISRRDVLHAAHGMISVAPNKEAALLYLSGLVERNEAPIG
jgi:CBS domain-containing protein